MNVLFIIGIGQALFFCLILISKKGDKFSRFLLSLWLVLISFSLFLNYLYETGLIIKFPHLIGLDTAFPFLYMPILYFYAKNTVNQNHKKKIKRINLLHLSPFIIYFSYVSLNFYTQTGDYKLAFLKKLSNFDYPLDIQFSNVLKIIQALLYMIIIFKIIKKHQVKINHNFSSIESINLSWLKVITLCLTIVYSFKFIGVISIYFNSNIFSGKINALSDLAIIAFVYVIAYYGIKQPDIFAKWNRTSFEKQDYIDVSNEQNKIDSNIIEPISKYQKSNLSKDDASSLLIALQSYMINQKPFLDSQLTIKDVADEMQVNTKNLSQVINEQLGLNFFNFINEYRVNEVKKRIISPEYNHLSILGIAYDCGFNSKSSFNSVFKKYTGETPTSYKSNIS